MPCAASRTARERRLRLARVALRPHPRRSLELSLLGLRVEPVQLDLLGLRLRVAVHADDHALARLDLLRVGERSLVDLLLDQPLLDRRDRAARLLDALHQLARALPRARRSAPR